MAIDKTRLQKTLTIGFGAVCGAVLYYHFVIDGLQLKLIAKRKQEVSDLQAHLARAKHGEERRAVLIASARRDESFLVAQEARIVKGDQVAWLWREMGDFADRQKMSRLAVVPEAATPNGLPENSPYEAAGASLNLSCGYHKLGAFLCDLENAFPTLQVHHLEIIGGGEAVPDTHTVRVQFQLLAVKEDKQKESGPGVAQGPSGKE